jgi:UTP-glucose-1-phosphate uridylyltransferase
MIEGVLDMADVTKAVIPSAGLGTRFLPATKATPKEMLPVVDKPAIQYVVEEAVSAGLNDVLLITGRSKRSIEDHFDRAYELEEALAARASRAASGTPSCAPLSMSGTSRSPYCSATTSSTRARRCSSA